MTSKGLFITGTDTGVGKTQVTAGLAAALIVRFAKLYPHNGRGRRARQVTLWKPVQTGVQLGDKDADSFILKMGSGSCQEEADIASITLPEPLAPWISAQRAGTAINFHCLVREGRRRLAEGRFLLVEGAGGAAVPITQSKLMANLAQELGLPVLIVARPGLGTVNHSLLTIAFARDLGLKVIGVVLNGFREGAEAALTENTNMIETFGHVKVIGQLPWFPCSNSTAEDWHAWRIRWAETVERQLHLDRLLNETDIESEG